MKIPFAKHTWLGFIRSPTLTKKVIEAVIIGFFGLYTAVSLISLGFAAPVIIGEFIPEANPIEVIAGGLCAYIFIDILIRFFVQKFPAITIKPYLILPIKRSRIVNFMLVRALLSPFNLIIPIFLIPFLSIVEIPEDTDYKLWGIIIIALSAILIANYTAYALTAFVGSSKKWAIGALIAIATLVYLEYNGITQFLPHLYSAGGVLVSKPTFWVIPVGAATLVILWLKRQFNKEISSYENTSANTSVGYLSASGFFSRFGKHGILIDMEILLIIRSRRARSLALSSLLFCFFPFFIMNEDVILPVFIAFTAFFVTGGFALNYGQLMLSWNSAHFDLLLSRGYEIKDIFTAKFYLLSAICFFTLLASLPYAFAISNYAFIAFSMTLWNASLTIFIYMILASVNSQRIDPNEGGMFNHSGFGIAHYLIAVPIIAIPILFYFIGWIINDTTGALLLVGLLGLLGLVFHKKLISICVSLFKKNRYKISKDFRIKE